MDRSARLQFHRLPEEAQRAALWRLALSGLSIEQISDQTGWAVEQIRRTVDPEPRVPTNFWQEARARAPDSARRD